MSHAEKELVRRVAMAYAEAQEPEVIDELETVFEATYRMLTRPDAGGPAIRWSHGRLHAESPFVEDSPSATILWITTELVSAFVREGEDLDVAAALAAITEQMARYTRQPRRVEGIAAAAMKEMRDELRQLRAAVDDLADRWDQRPGGSEPELHVIPWAALDLSPPDLEMRVRTELLGGERYLSYVLDSPAGKVPSHRHAIRGRKLVGSLADYGASLLRKLERIHGGTGIGGGLTLGRESEKELVALGRELYEELFPEALRAAYRRFREEVTTLVVVSDEPWIPWELVRPYDDSVKGEVVDDDFLGARFQLTRWLPGEDVAPPAPGIAVERLACFEAGRVADLEPLPFAETERRWLGELAERRGVEDRSLDAATAAGVERRLTEQAIDLVHFVGHGEADPEQPEESGLYMCDGRPLRPRDFHGEIRTRIRQRRPLVFLNACQLARQSPSLTSFGGWVGRWVRQCGCGAFVGPLWTVDDRLAHEFAIAFFAALEAGKTFGEASLAARHRVRGIDPSRPTWLAFVVYAHPHAQVTWVSPR